MGSMNGLPQNALTSGLWVGLGCICLLLFPGRIRIQPGFPWAPAAQVAPLAQSCPPAELQVRRGARSSSEVLCTVPCKGQAGVIPLSLLLELSRV